jgi:predicted nuclease of predicted toxin-antitoxin system
MKILLDECVPWPMRKMLANHECSNPFRYGWNGVTNGELLKLAENEFELFITADQNLRYQQNLSGRRIAILELSTNDLRRILAAEALIVEAVASIKGGEYLQLEIPES